MRPVTVKQWTKMPLRTKSWLVVKAFGFWVDVYWHIHADYLTEETLSGSLKNEKEIRRLLKVAIKHNRVPKTAVVRRSLCYWGCADALHPAWEVVKEVLKAGFTVNFQVGPEGVYCLLANHENQNCHVGWGLTLSESVCSAALKMKGLLIQ